MIWTWRGLRGLIEEGEQGKERAERMGRELEHLTRRGRTLIAWFPIRVNDGELKIGWACRVGYTRVKCVWVEGRGRVTRHIPSF